MKLWGVVLFLTLGALQAQPQPKSPPDDDASSFVHERRAAAGQHPDFDALCRSGQANLEKGNFEQAEKAFRAALEESPDNPTALIGIARVYIAREQPDAALRFLQDEVALHPRAFGATSALIDISVQLNRFDLAMATAETAPGGNLMEVAELERLAGNYDAAIANLEKVREHAVKWPSVDIHLAEVLAEAGRQDEALKIYQSVLGVDPRDGAALLRRYDAILNTTSTLDTTLLTACAKLAAKALPDSPAAQDDLGWSYIITHKPDQAIAIYQTLLAKAPQSSTYHYHLAQALFFIDDREHTRRELLTALQCDPPADEKRRIEAMLTTLDMVADSEKQ